ncbi:hypothetical protein [Streptomyces sp. NPDC013740]|uniref:hypothetical protein n=1 Tax=Streptomyces sp. NPDC013740 TaxID=3364867 RepID=UPI0036FE46BE
MTLVVHDETAAAADALVGAGREARGPSGADAVVVVTVLVSHGLKARLSRARRRDFGAITTAGG